MEGVTGMMAWLGHVPGGAGEASTGTRTSTNRFFRIVSVAEMNVAFFVSARRVTLGSRVRVSSAVAC